jgi:hypothetical protein
MEKWMETVVADTAEAVSATGKCTRQLVPIADKSAKYLLNLRLESLYTAGTAIRSTESLEATKHKRALEKKGCKALPFFFFLFFSKALFYSIFSGSS